MTPILQAIEEATALQGPPRQIPTTDEPVVDEALAILRNTRDLLARKWRTGALYENGRYCTVGALIRNASLVEGHGRRYAGEDTDEGSFLLKQGPGFDAMRLVAEAVQRSQGRRVARHPTPHSASTVIMSFNDTSSRRCVLKVVDAAIEARKEALTR